MQVITDATLKSQDEIAKFVKCDDSSMLSRPSPNIRAAESNSEIRRLPYLHRLLLGRGIKKKLANRHCDGPSSISNENAIDVEQQQQKCMIKNDHNNLGPITLSALGIPQALGDSELPSTLSASSLIGDGALLLSSDGERSIDDGNQSMSEKSLHNYAEIIRVRQRMREAVAWKKSKLLAGVQEDVLNNDIQNSCLSRLESLQETGTRCANNSSQHSHLKRSRKREENDFPFPDWSPRLLADSNVFDSAQRLDSSDPSCQPSHHSNRLKKGCTDSHHDDILSADYPVSQVHGRQDYPVFQVHGRQDYPVSQVHGRQDYPVSQVHGRQDYPVRHCGRQQCSPNRQHGPLSLSPHRRDPRHRQKHKNNDFSVSDDEDNDSIYSSRPSMRKVDDHSDSRHHVAVGVSNGILNSRRKTTTSQPSSVIYPYGPQHRHSTSVLGPPSFPSSNQFIPLGTRRDLSTLQNSSVVENGRFLSQASPVTLATQLPPSFPSECIGSGDNKTNNNDDDEEEEEGRAISRASIASVGMASSQRHPFQTQNPRLHTTPAAASQVSQSQQPYQDRSSSNSNSSNNHQHCLPRDDPLANNQKHSENEVLPALKRKLGAMGLSHPTFHPTGVVGGSCHPRSSSTSSGAMAMTHEPLDFNTLLEETLRLDEAGKVQGNTEHPTEHELTTTGESSTSINGVNLHLSNPSCENSAVDKPSVKQHFLKKGSRNPFSVVPPKRSLRSHDISSVGGRAMERKTQPQKHQRKHPNPNPSDPLKFIPHTLCPSVPRPTFLRGRAATIRRSNAPTRSAIVHREHRPSNSLNAQRDPIVKQTTTAARMKQGMKKVDSVNSIALMTTMTGGGNDEEDEHLTIHDSETMSRQTSMVRLSSVSIVGEGNHPVQRSNSAAKKKTRSSNIERDPTPLEDPTRDLPSVLASIDPIRLAVTLDDTGTGSSKKKEESKKEPLEKTARRLSNSPQDVKLHNFRLNASQSGSKSGPSFTLPEPSALLYGHPGSSYGEVKRKELLSQGVTGLDNSHSPTTNYLKKKSVISKEKELHSGDYSSVSYIALTAQAQAKIAAVDEEVKKLRLLQCDLERRREKLDAEKAQWVQVRDNERIALAAEREAAMADIEASRRSLKKDRKRYDSDFESLQDLSINSEKLEEQNRQLKLSLAQLQDELIGKEDRYRLLIERLQNKNYLLEKKNESLSMSVEKFEKTSNQLSRRLIQQQKAAERTAGLRTTPRINPGERNHAPSSSFRQPTVKGQKGSYSRPSIDQRAMTSPIVRPSQRQKVSSQFPFSSGPPVQHHRGLAETASLDQHRKTRSCISECNLSSSSESSSLASERLRSEGLPEPPNWIAAQHPIQSDIVGGHQESMDAKYHTRKEEVGEAERRKDNPPLNQHSVIQSKQLLSPRGGFNVEGLRTGIEQQQRQQQAAISHCSHEDDQIHRPHENKDAQLKSSNRMIESSTSKSTTVAEKNQLPISEYEDLLRFDLASHWKPFDDALKSLGLPEGLELVSPVIVKPDGRKELVFKDGHREILFSDKTRKVVAPTGWIFSFFPNGDIRGLAPIGTQFYYFYKDRIYNIITCSGESYNAFPDGQVDCRYPDGKIQVKFPQGFLKQIDTNGTEHVQQQAVKTHMQ